MVRPQDLERAQKFIKLRESKVDTPPVEPNPGSIFVTKAKELQKTRKNALLGMKAGDREPLGRYRDELGIYKAYLHLGNHLTQWSAAELMLMEVGADKDNAQIIDALEHHEQAINALCRGALGS